MSTLLSSSRYHRMVRGSQAASMAVACALLLSGCAIWPKSLTFWGGAEEPPPAQPVAAAQPAPAPAEPVEIPPIVMSAPVAEPASPEVTPVASLPSEPKPVVPPAAPSKPAGPVKMERGYYINVGLFAVPSNASNAFQKLDQAGLPAYTELLETNVGKLVRVRVGGFPTKAQADAAAKKIRSLQLEAIVFRYNKK